MPKRLARALVAALVALVAVVGFFVIARGVYLLLDLAVGDVVGPYVLGVLSFLAVIVAYAVGATFALPEVYAAPDASDTTSDRDRHDPGQTRARRDGRDGRDVDRPGRA